MGVSSSFVTGRGDTMQPTALAANELTAAHIGNLIRFRVTRDDRETVAIVTGELRQLSANQAEVHVRLGIGAEDEHTLEHDATVILRPAEHYGDVEVYLGRDPEYAQMRVR